MQVASAATGEGNRRVRHVQSSNPDQLSGMHSPCHRIPLGQCLGCTTGWVPGQYCLCCKDQGCWLGQATYVFDPGTFIEGEQTRQMRYRPTIESNFSILVVLHPEGRIETFKYCGSALICDACGPDFRTAMIHTCAGGLAVGEPWTRVEMSEPSPAA
jgi:hypothetical protein